MKDVKMFPYLICTVKENNMTDILKVQRAGDFSYPIYFKKDFLGLGEAVQEASPGWKRIAVISDDHVAPLYCEPVLQELQARGFMTTLLVLPSGEPNKNLNTIQMIYRHLIENGLDRKDCLAALGGGVIGDMTGFAAATYLRGIDFIQIPTTLLSQVDSSVGGKTGVDFENYKNMVGAFYQPKLVYMNLSALNTLPEEELICGMGEVVKTGLICDAELFRYACSNCLPDTSFSYDVFRYVVRRCCEIKAEIVERDPEEKGERALLNLGHTIGHAVEKLKDFSLKHGQCVGIGLRVAAALSLSRGYLSKAEYNEILTGLVTVGLPVSVSGLTGSEIIAATKKDKKMAGGRIRFILMDGIGKSHVDYTVTDEDMLLAIKEILA